MQIFPSLLSFDTLLDNCQTVYIHHEFISIFHMLLLYSIRFSSMVARQGIISFTCRLVLFQHFSQIFYGFIWQSSGFIYTWSVLAPLSKSDTLSSSGCTCTLTRSSSTVLRRWWPVFSILSVMVIIVSLTVIFRSRAGL